MRTTHDWPTPAAADAELVSNGAYRGARHSLASQAVSAPLLPDERLAWLAARDYCTAKAKQHRPAFWLLFVLGARRHRGSGIRADANNHKLKLYAVAVDQLVDRLTPDERRTLR